MTGEGSAAAPGTNLAQLTGPAILQAFCVQLPQSSNRPTVVVNDAKTRCLKRNTFGPPSGVKFQKERLPSAERS